jgi:hypothetical protein
LHTVPLRFVKQGFAWKMTIANNLISGCRLDNMDTYSNLLYVKEQRVELAHLAHRYYMQGTLLLYSKATLKGSVKYRVVDLLS